MGFWDSDAFYPGTWGKDAGNALGNLFGMGSGDPGNPYRNALAANAAQQGQFGQGLQGQYMQNQAGIGDTMGMLRGLAQGQNSVAAEQLRQGMQQGVNAQQAMAASAAPQDQAMAARNAMMNMSKLGYGLSGQQAMAGLQERQNALNSLAQMQMQQSGQNLQGALGAGGLANSAYGSNLQYPQKTLSNMLGGALGGLAAAGG